VVIKAHIARLTATGGKAASLHLGYIQRDGIEKDGSPGVLYDASGPARSEAFEQPRIDERHQFRLIVSPEDAGEFDLTDYVRRLIVDGQRFPRECGQTNPRHFGHPFPRKDGQGNPSPFDARVINRRVQRVARQRRRAR
jgi:hypothetical protein